MEKQVFYVVVEKLLVQSIGDVEETNGRKHVRVYQMPNDEPIEDQELILVHHVTLDITDNTNDEITDRLNANYGIEKDRIKLVHL